MSAGLSLVRVIIISLCIGFLAACQTTRYHGPTSDHFDGKAFHNLGEKNASKHPWYDLYVMWRAVMQNPWPEKSPDFEIEGPLKSKQGSEIVFIGHSTLLIKTPRLNILTDPVYSNRASPLPFLGPERISKPGFAFNNLPSIGVVLISHNHYDHMELSTLKKLEQSFHPVFIVPIGNGVILKRAGIKQVVELDWWQQVTVKSTVITLLPARHSSQRSWLDYNHSLWGAYGISSRSEKIFFAGDTGYGDHFKAIRSRWGQPDVSLIPIGAYSPRTILKGYHLNPEDAVKAHLDLGSKRSIGIHWGTFQLGSEPVTEPLTGLDTARKKYGVKKSKFYVLDFGRSTFAK